MSGLTFEQFLRTTAAEGKAINTLFEERLFDLVGVLHKIARVLSVEGISYELIGGLAVLVHVEEVNPEHTALTRDVDLMIRREDLERIKEAAAKNGFRFRHAAGVDMLLYGETDSAKNAVHLIFSGEIAGRNQAVPNPAIAPEKKRIHGGEVMVIPVADLVRMKLSSFRDKDRVHVRSMDAAGLIAPEVEAKLPPELLTRLQHVRETE
jgi:predicted DNA binding CopG/RHH family protein